MPKDISFGNIHSIMKRYIFEGTLQKLGGGSLGREYSNFIYMFIKYTGMYRCTVTCDQAFFWEGGYFGRRENGEGGKNAFHTF